MKTVRFKERVPPYQPGEVAGFEDEVAERLVKQGLAEWWRLLQDDHESEAPEPKPGKREHRS